MPMKHCEVFDVFRDHCSSLDCRRVKQIYIRQPSEIIALRYDDGVDPANPQCFCYRRGVHLIE